VRFLRILNVCAEFVPLAKAGGLGDVTSALASYLTDAGHDVVTILPRYGLMPAPETEPVDRTRQYDCAGSEHDYSIFPADADDRFGRVYVVECPELFGKEIYAAGEAELHRFALLSIAALVACRALDWSPEVLHCHDWHTALMPAMLRDAARSDALFVDTSSVLTIHNIGYQGVFPTTAMRDVGLDHLLEYADADDVDRDEINLLRTGIMHADAMTTVSPTHAIEIRTPEYGMGLDALLRQRGHRLQGILNGVDYSLWSPDSDAHLEAGYSADTIGDKRRNKLALTSEAGLSLDADTPVVGMISRLVLQKGIDLLVDVLPGLFDERELGCVVLGTGEPPYTDDLRSLAAARPDRLAFIEAYDDRMAHRILAGCDMLVIPSRYEPCGLTQMYALRYGTVPVVRKTGGLADSIRHFDPESGAGNGIVFEHADPSGLRWGLSTALDWYDRPETWGKIVRNGMAEDFSWAHRAPEYDALYRTIAGRRATTN